MTEPFVERRAPPPITMADVDRHVSEKVGVVEKNLASAIPDEDYIAHRRYHEGLMKEDEDRKKLRSELFATVLKYVVQAGLMALGAVLLLGLQTQFSNMVSSVVDQPRAVPGVKK